MTALHLYKALHSAPQDAHTVPESDRFGGCERRPVPVWTAPKPQSNEVNPAMHIANGDCK